eukprot:SAG11_NODE_7044_length_1203_cov_1.985507_1_plen_219_part_00
MHLCLELTLAIEVDPRSSRAMLLNDAELSQFCRDGYIVKAGCFSAKQMDAARVAMEQLYFNGSTFEAWLATMDAAGSSQRASTLHVPPELGQETARAKFPVGVTALDSLIQTPAFLDMYEQCLGDAAVFCDAHLFHRAGLTDKRHPAEPLQGFHMDHNTNCWLPPAPDGAFGCERTASPTPARRPCTTQSLRSLSAAESSAPLVGPLLCRRQRHSVLE